jgi:hypothetical protein
MSSNAAGRAVMGRDVDRVLAALDHRPGWGVVLLRGNAKVPVASDGTWAITRDADPIVRHLEAGGNIGVRGGPEADLVIFDIDHGPAYAELWDRLGPLADATVETAHGKLHTYTRWAPGVPATLVTPDGEVVGEPRRGAMQYAVCPPSTIEGRPYRFLDGVDLTRPLPEIPRAWLDYFARVALKLSAPPRDVDSSALADRYEAALQQPGARRRAGGRDVKFACPACRALGRDTAQDNARLFSRGGWGCAVYPRGTPGSLTHWRAIGIALGVLGPDGRPAR